MELEDALPVPTVPFGKKSDLAVSTEVMIPIIDGVRKGYVESLNPQLECSDKDPHCLRLSGNHCKMVNLGGCPIFNKKRQLVALFTNSYTSSLGGSVFYSRNRWEGDKFPSFGSYPNPLSWQVTPSNQGKVTIAVDIDWIKKLIKADLSGEIYRSNL